MQINLGEIPTLIENPLPPAGMLYYFIAEDDGDIEGRVLLVDGERAHLRRHPEPTTDNMAVESYVGLKPHPIGCVLGIDLPDYGSDEFSRVVGRYPKDTDPDASHRYFALASEAMGHTPGNPSVGKLLGHITDRIRLDPVRKRFGLVGSQLIQFRASHSAEYEAELRRWRSLWRIDSDPFVGACYNDSGSVHVLIPNEKLGRLDFGGILSILESG